MFDHPRCVGRCKFRIFHKTVGVNQVHRDNHEFTLSFGLIPRQHEERGRWLIITAVFFCRQAILQRNQVFALLYRLPVKQSAPSAESITGEMHGVFRHGLFYARNILLPVPVAGFTVLLLLSEDLFDLDIVGAVKGEPFLCKAFMVHISYDNIQVGVLCMVQVIDGPAFQQVKLLPEFRDHSRLHVNNLRRGIPFLQQCRDRLGGLARFYQLAIDKALLFIIGKRRLPCQAAVLFLGHQAGFFQMLPVWSHRIADLLRQGVAVALSPVQLGFDQHKVIHDAVIFYITLRVDMIQIVGAVRQVAQIDGLACIGALPQLEIVQEQPVTLQAVIRHDAHFLQLLCQAACVLAFDLLVELQQLIFSCFGSLSFLLRRSSPRHFHKDFSRRLSHCLHHFLHNIRRAENGPFYCIGNIHGREPIIERLRAGRIVFFADLLDLLGKGVPVGEKLHQVFVGIPQHFHNGKCLSVRILFRPVNPR